jgi:hypothetical protein
VFDETGDAAKEQDSTREALAEAEIGEDAREQIRHRNEAAMLARVNTAQRERAAD